MKKMKTFSFRWKDAEGKTHYESVVAENFQAAINAKYNGVLPDFEYISSDEVDVVLPNE